MGRNGHDGSRAVAREHIFRDPNGDALARERVDAIGSGEDTRHLVVGHAVALRALGDIGEIGLHLLALLAGSQLGYQLRLRSQYHEGDAEDRVGTCGEDGEVAAAFLRALGCDALEAHLRSLAASHPVALGLLDGVAPVHEVQSVEHPLRIGRNAQAPLAHLALDDGVATAHAHAVHHLVVGQHRAQVLAPVDHRLAEVGDAVVHERLLLLLLIHAPPVAGRKDERLRLGHVHVERALLLEVAHQLVDGARLLRAVVVVRLKHPLKGPLGPMVVAGVAGAHLAAPVEAESYLVQLLAVALDVLLRRHRRVLSGLDGILLGGQSVGIVAHGVEDVEALLALVARVDVAGDVAQRVADVQTCSRGIGEHVEDVELLTCWVLRHLVGLMVPPVLLPFLFDLSEIVFHCYVFVLSLVLFAARGGVWGNLRANLQKTFLIEAFFS